MIQFTCPECHSKLNAKDELAGQTRPCPKCRSPVLIAPEDVELAALQVHEPVAAEGLRHFDRPERLERRNRYVICDNSKPVAMWENNGRGWMLSTLSGAVPAARNQDKIPTQGNFKLIEFQMEDHNGALRLAGIAVYELSGRWALLALPKGDDHVLGSVVAPAALNKDLKAAVRAHLREHFMRGLWEDAHHVLEYLANDDYHSAGVSKAG
jgi:hypothetical protein